MILRKESFLWLGLAAAAAVTIGFLGGRVNSWAATEGESVQPVLVVPVQLGRDSYGVAMVDTKKESIWVYEISTRGPAHTRLKLLAARSWHYDRMLEEYNSAEPQPQQVKDIIEQLLKPGGSRPNFDVNSTDITSMVEPNKQSE
jgi:hypothetical protein